jgi:hypothetical protein
MRGCKHRGLHLRCREFFFQFVGDEIFGRRLQCVVIQWVYVTLSSGQREGGNLPEKDPTCSWSYDKIRACMRLGGPLA